jgi:tetratricopeptide (TPR) repeat protein
MIVDNADDPSVFFKQAEGEELDSATRSLADFLPQSPNGSLLITSRNRDVAFRLTGDASDIINVEPLDKKQSVDLLCKKLSSAPDREDAIELVEALDGMPLAITQAAAFISRGEPRMTVSKYLQDLRASDENRAQLLKKDIGDARRDGKASNSIMSTWEISFKYIRNNWPSAAQLLSLMSLFDRQGIPEILLRDKYSHDNETELNLDDDISILASYSLITINHDGNDFEMHRLVQFATKKWLELNEELELWKEKYIEILYEDFPAGEYENWKICQKLFPHAQMVLLYRPANDECLRKWAGILHEAGRYADTRGNYNMAEEMIRQSLEGLQQVLGGEPQPTLAAMANLATTYEHQGRWKEAQGIQEQVLEMFIRVLGKEHPTTLLSMANLGLIYNRQHRWREAEEMLVSGLEMCSRVLGQEHETTRVCMNNLALTYRDQGRWKEAEELFTQVRDTATRTLGTEHPLSLIYMSNLALVYWDQGRRKEAEELQAQVAEMRARVLGEQHPNTLRAVKYLEVYRSTYQLDEALNADAQETEKSSVLGEKRRNGPTRVAKLMYRKFKDTLRGHK